MTSIGKQTICIVSPNFLGGGAQKVAINLANYYATQGHIIHLLVFKNYGPYRDDVDEAVNVISLEVSRTRHAFFRLYKALKYHKPDVVLSVISDANVAVGVISLFYKKWRNVYREANTMDVPNSKNKIFWAFYLCLMRLAYSKADAVIANSEDTKKDLMKYKISTNDNCIVISNPVIPSNFDVLCRQPVNHPWLVNEKYKTLLNIGRLHEQKNQTMLLHAFSKAHKEMNELRLLIIGEGKLKKDIEKLSIELSVNDYVQILDFQKNPFPFYMKSDLFILSSKWEGFGNVLVEALACGTDVLSTACPGGVREILDEGKYGVLVPSDDVEEMATAILKIINSKSRNEKPNNILVDRGKAYSVENIAEKYLQVLSVS